MCAFESFAPILVAAAQINSDVRKFFENTTSDGLVQIRDVIFAFSNPTKKKLRETKNRVRDFMRKIHAFFFNRPISSIPFYNIARFLDGLFILANTIKSLIGLRCFGVARMLGLWISSNRQQTVAYGRHKVVGGYLYCLH